MANDLAKLSDDRNAQTATWILTNCACHTQHKTICFLWEINFFYLINVQTSLFCFWRRLAKKDLYSNLKTWGELTFSWCCVYIRIKSVIQCTLEDPFVLDSLGSRKKKRRKDLKAIKMLNGWGSLNIDHKSLQSFP